MIAHILLTPSYGGLAHALLAYLDPGSGSFILQLLIAGILGGLVALRMSWSKLKARFTRRPEGSDDASTPPEDKSGE